MHYLSPLPPSPPVLTLQSDTNTEQILKGTERFSGLVWFKEVGQQFNGVLIRFCCQ